MGATDLDFLFRLLLATGCGLLIGLERQYRSRTAGLRTHALVAAGACAFVQFGEQAGIPSAPLQITAYVVSGVGFLGGGVILRQGFSVQGLNTAATLWCSAAVGCQAAGGHLVPALALTAVVLAVHILLRPIGRLVDRAPAAKDEVVHTCTITVLTRRKHDPRTRAQLIQALSEPELSLRELTSDIDHDNGQTVRIQATVLVEGSPAQALDALVTRLSLEPDIASVSWRTDDPDPRRDDDADDGSGAAGPTRSRDRTTARWPAADR